MRGLLLIGMLIALAVVAYLQMNSANTALKSDKETAKNKMEQVEQDVNAAMEAHMQNLQRSEPDIQ